MNAIDKFWLVMCAGIALWGIVTLVDLKRTTRSGPDNNNHDI